MRFLNGGLCWPCPLNVVFVIKAWSSLQFKDPTTGIEFDGIFSHSLFHSKHVCSLIVRLVVRAAKEFEEYFGELTYTTTLSDGQTVAEVMLCLRQHRADTWCIVYNVQTRPGGKHERVLYADRYVYAREAFQSRFHESFLPMEFLRRVRSHGTHTCCLALRC